MSQSNMVLFMEYELDLELFNDLLLKFDARKQELCWAIEKNDGCIWIHYCLMKDDEDAKNTWAIIVKDNFAKAGNKDIKCTISIQPSRSINSIFMALEFCQAIYDITDKNSEVFLDHEHSGLFANDEIKYLKFKNGGQFYDSRFIDREIVDSIIKSLEGEFLSAIETVVEDGGWDGDEIEYTDLFKNLFLMREQLDSDMINSSIEVRQQLNLVDELILELLTVDEEELLIKAGEEYRGEPITSWWWHLDKVKRKELVVSVGEGLLRYQDDIIKL